MRYFSEDATYINTECDKCKRILKIMRNDCEEQNFGYGLTKDCNCLCGNIFNYINGKELFEKEKPKPANTNKTNSSYIGIFILIALIALIVFGVKSCSSAIEESTQQRIQHEKNAFQQQMKQSPSNWNQEQKDRYNNFIKWDQEQKQK